MKRLALAILVVGIVVNLSVFLRNELLFKQYWITHYEALGLRFPSSPLNGALWGLWGFIFAGCIVALGRKASFVETIALGWTMGFVLMWVVIGNLDVLPFGLLPAAVPWSLVEVVLAVLITQWILGRFGTKQHHPGDSDKPQTTLSEGLKPDVRS